MFHHNTFYEQTDGVAMGGPTSSPTAEIYMQTCECTAITTALHPPKVWEQFGDDVCPILKHTLLKQNNGEISLLVYRKPTHTDQYLHYSSHHQTSCKESVLPSLFNRAYCIITNKNDLHKENARIKKVLTGEWISRKHH